MWLTIANLYFVSVITADPFRLTLLLVVLECSTVVFELPTGLIADSFSRKWSMVIGYVIWGGGFLLQALLPIYEATLLSQAIWGLGFTFVSGAPEAWLVDEVGQEEASALFLRGAQLGQASTLLGIAMATVLASLHLALPIAIGGISTIMLALLLALVMPETGFQRAANQGVSFARLRRTVSVARSMLRGGSFLRLVILIGLVIGSSAGAFDAMYAAHIIGNYSLPFFESEVWFGILLASVTLLTMPAIELARRWLQIGREKGVTLLLSVFAGGTILGNLVFVWSPGFPVAALAFCMSQVLRTASKPIFMIWINRHLPSETRATGISLYWQFNAIGQIVCAPLLGIVGTLSSLRLALSCASLALLPVIPLYRRHRPQTLKDSA